MDPNDNLNALMALVKALMEAQLTAGMGLAGGYVKAKLSSFFWKEEGLAVIQDAVANLFVSIGVGGCVGRIQHSKIRL